ncbi:unnamed protein product [Heligmosomoides polygyrus]|uniref:Uncharacterized protein n=1 Tax=Heligmosomoides polygyrus TaxID=6339 RepID=A0A183FEF1_HELPZ|nr:unnamed protein product [Heligmosomoides polygyrus]
MWETRWSCCKSRDIGRGFKAILCGSPRTTSGVGVVVSERFRDAIASVERFSDRLMKVVVAAEQRMYHFFSAYAPQTGCSERAKDEFWTLLDEKTAEVPPEERSLLQVISTATLGLRKMVTAVMAVSVMEHVTLLVSEFLMSMETRIISPSRTQCFESEISFYSGNTKTQIDFILVKHRDRRLVTDAKVVPYETVATQHRPLISTLKFAPPRLRQVISMENFDDLLEVKLEDDYVILVDDSSAFSLRLCIGHTLFLAGKDDKGW